MDENQRKQFWTATESHLEKMNNNFESLCDNIAVIHPKKSIQENAQIEDFHFNELHRNVKMQSLDSLVASHSLVEVVNALSDLITELQLNYILNDENSIKQYQEDLSNSIEQNLAQSV